MLAFLALAGCQLLVDDVPFPSCVDIDPQCVDSSRERGSGDCVSHRCDAESGRCLPFGEGEEACDGFDNDCDGTIDEAGPAPTFAAHPSEAIAVLEETISDHRLRYGVDREGLEVIALLDGRRPHLVRLAGTSREVRELDLRSSRRVDEIDLVGALADGCVRASLAECTGGACPVEPAGCAFFESAVAGPASGLGAAILLPTSAPPERAANLQVGTLAAGDPNAELSFRGPPYLSNTFAGARLDAGCAGCEPRVVALDAFATSEGGIDRTAGMLVAFSSSGSTPVCPATTTAEVGVLSLLVDRDAERPVSPWIVGSNGGVLERLGDTAALGPPAIDSVGPSSASVPEGFVVAYASASEIRVHFVARPPFTRIAPTCTDCSEPSATPPLAPRAEPDASIAATDARFVAIAAAEPREGRVRLLIVRAEGCATQRVVAQTIDLDFGTAIPSATLGTEHVLATAGALDSTPAVLYRESGFLRAGTEHAGATVGEDEDGGFYVAFTEATGVRLVRVRELDGEILDETTLAITGARALALYGATDPGDELALVFEDGDRLARTRLCR